MNDPTEFANRLLPLLPQDVMERVLDGGFVELVDFMGDDDSPVDAARVSFYKTAEQYTDEQNDKLTRYLLEHKHGTPFEMVVFKFRVRAPVVVWWQWVRHRIASYNFVSGRYVPFDETAVHRVNDDAWRLQSKSNKQGSSGELIQRERGAMLNAQVSALYNQAFQLYEEMLELGVAREQARLVLPFAACYYEAIVLMNARSLMNFLDLREDQHAQHEIRVYAQAVRSIVSKTHPRLFKR